MGFRYRKSINLGGGFRINLSKSGIGYSWGVKGYRVTKTAKGTTRTTASIPGTGISYVHETGKANNRSSQRNTNPGQQPVPAIDNNHYDTQNIVNNVATEIVNTLGEDCIDKIKTDKHSLDIVRGMTEKRRETIYETLTSGDYDQEVMRFFMGHGISLKNLGLIQKLKSKSQLNSI